MECIIDQTIRYYLKKGKKLEAIRRYLRMKYRITMDIQALKRRMESVDNDLRMA